MTIRTPKYPLQTIKFGRKKIQGGTTTGVSAILPEIQFWPKKTRIRPKMATAWCKLTIRDEIEPPELSFPGGKVMPMGKRILGGIGSPHNTGRVVGG